MNCATAGGFVRVALHVIGILPLRAVIWPTSKLRNRYNTATFSMLYMCVFVDSKIPFSAFSDTETCVEVYGSHGRILTDAARPLVTGQYGAALTQQR